MSHTPKIVVITGAESTGKSTLTEELANYFKVPFIPEIAREYIETLNRKYTYYDVESIAFQQVELFNRMKMNNIPVLFLDTWLIITKVWFEIVYTKKPEWLTKTISGIKIDLFLVCDTDLPWVADPVRENGGEKRLKLQKMYIRNITDYGFQYRIVNGKGEKRFESALSFVKEIMNIPD